MATEAQIGQLRLLIAEPEDAEPYTDTALDLRIDAASNNLTKVAGDIWTEKAAAAAALVDTTEGGSSRKMGDIYEQALGMAAQFRKDEAALVPTTGRYTIVAKIRRP